MMLSACIGYHFVHIFHIHDKTTSVVLSASEDDCIPFYFWYLENLEQRDDLESADKYESMPKESNHYARSLTRSEFDRLITDWENILETGYKCKDPLFYGTGMFRFYEPIKITSPDEQNRLKAELEAVQKLAEGMNWDEDEMVLVIAGDGMGVIRQIIVV